MEILDVNFFTFFLIGKAKAFIRCISEIDNFNFLQGVALVDMSVLVFGKIFPRAANKHKLQMIQHFKGNAHNPNLLSVQSYVFVFQQFLPLHYTLYRCSLRPGVCQF